MPAGAWAPPRAQSGVLAATGPPTPIAATMPPCALLSFPKAIMLRFLPKVVVLVLGAGGAFEVGGDP
ncbi:hypothetical protein [Baekduia sp.]|uniref:hypothetical protein n=1 Tax=Baekduia sp. TaxID=2600305 RepID=UPI002E08E59F|nr:hypothetical protein [Baekduia sp.]